MKAKLTPALAEELRRRRRSITSPAAGPAIPTFPQARRLSHGVWFHPPWSLVPMRVFIPWSLVPHPNI
jgi:hypothetical protein